MCRAATNSMRGVLILLITFFMLVIGAIVAGTARGDEDQLIAGCVIMGVTVVGCVVACVIK